MAQIVLFLALAFLIRILSKQAINELLEDQDLSKTSKQ